MKQISSAPQYLTTLPELVPTATELVQSAVPACGCAVSDHAPDSEILAAVDPVVRDRNVVRLRRIEGQVRGLQKMIQDDRYCADILVQVSSVHEALRAVGRELMRGHLRYSAHTASRTGATEPISDEIIEMIYRAAR